MEHYKSRLPGIWASVICQCKKVNYDGWSFKQPNREFRADIKLFSCKACKKPDILSLKICQGCSAIFLKDFQHPKWILEWPRCFPCLESDNSRATEVTLTHLSRGRETERIPPQLEFLYLHLIDPEFEARVADSVFKFPG